MVVKSSDVIGKRSENSHNFLLPQTLRFLTSFTNDFFVLNFTKVKKLLQSKKISSTFVKFLNFAKVYTYVISI